MRSTTQVRAVENAFCVVDDDLDMNTADYRNGLIVTMASGAEIFTGIRRGLVHVTVEVIESPPERIDPEAWDDIIEASVHAPQGRLGIYQREYADGDWPVRLPVLSSRGSGIYRMRAHVRGRDLARDADVEVSEEHYLLTVWPTDEAQPDVIIRATDRCGHGVRSTAQAPPATPAPLREIQQTPARKPGTGSGRL